MVFSEGTLPIASKFYVGRRFINVTGRSAFCILTSVFISTIFFTIRIPIANQGFADALTWAGEKLPEHIKEAGGENTDWDHSSTTLTD